jgi:hypothetical protein
MANTNAPFGMRPVRYASGAPYNGAFNEYFATGATGVIAVGDPVVAAGSANTTEVQGRAAGTLPTVTIALDGDNDPILGVCVGVVAVTNSSLPYREDSTDRIIQVADDPALIFQMQTDAGGTAFAATDVGLHCCAKVGTASTVYGTSTWTLDTADAPANDPSNQFRLMGLAKFPNNEIGTYGVWEVMINNHILANVDDAGRMTAV